MKGSNSETIYSNSKFIAGNKVVELNLGNVSTSGELLEVITHEGVHAFEDNKEDDEIFSLNNFF